MHAQSTRKKMLCGAMPVLLFLLPACEESPAPKFEVPLTVAESDAQGVSLSAEVKDGTIYVTWVQQKNDTAEVRLACWEPGAARPSLPVRVNGLKDPPPSPYASAKVRVGPEGNVYVAWTTSFAIAGREWPGANIVLAVSTDRGKTFSPAVAVNDDAASFSSEHNFHDVAVAADGAVYVSWIDFRVQDRTRQLRAQAAPSPAILLASSAHAMHGSESKLPGTEIRLACSRDGGRSFGENVVVDTTACECCPTACACGPDGSVVVSWRKIFGDNLRDIAVARSMDGGRSFTVPLRVHQQDEWKIEGCPHNGPSLVIDSQRRTHVAWYTGREGREGIYYAQAYSGQMMFSAPQAVLVKPGLASSHIRLAQDAKGKLWRVWEDHNTPEAQIYLCRFGENEVPMLVGSGIEPEIVFTKEKLVVVWQENGALRARIGAR